MDALLATIRPDVHQVQPAALSITNASEYGCVYTPDETAALGALAKRRGLRFHLDGARFANAVASLGCAPADLSWRAGVDALSFGFTKNGALAAEALILFDPALAAATHYRRKRAGHLLSKGRYLAAQILAMLDGRRLAEECPRRQRFRGAARRRRRARTGCCFPVEANEMFIRVSRRGSGGAAQRRASISTIGGPGEARLVTSWDSDPAEVDALAAAIRTL